MAKVTGIGGVFFIAHDKQKLSEWYVKHLGFRLEDFGGAVLSWEKDTRIDGGISVWCLAEQKSEWFSPSKSSFMINYRVDNLAELLEQLKKQEVEIHQGPEKHENGEFAWIIDPEGNKIELWEPAEFKT